MFFLLVYSNSIFGQIPDNVKKKDTVYFFFDHGKFQSCLYCNSEINVQRKTREHYNYIVSSNEWFTFIYKEYADLEGSTLTDVRILNKSFLKKRCDEIITIDEIIKYGMLEITRAFINKIIYVIDSKEIKKNKIIARKVWFNSSFIEE